MDTLFVCAAEGCSVKAKCSLSSSNTRVCVSLARRGRSACSESGPAERSQQSGSRQMSCLLHGLLQPHRSVRLPAASLYGTVRPTVQQIFLCARQNIFGPLPLYSILSASQQQQQLAEWVVSAAAVSNRMVGNICCQPFFRRERILLNEQKRPGERGEIIEMPIVAYLYGFGCCSDAASLSSWPRVVRCNWIWGCTALLIHTVNLSLSAASCVVLGTIIRTSPSGLRSPWIGYCSTYWHSSSTLLFYAPVIWHIRFS